MFDYAVDDSGNTLDAKKGKLFMVVNWLKMQQQKVLLTN
jgi:hypothetical protein